MIYTITCNPSLDYYVKVNNIKAGVVNRSYAEETTIGGKGINVSIALNEMGEETMALGFVAGFTGQAITESFKKMDIPFRFFQVDGLSRINVKIKSNSETDINGTGSNVQAKDITKLVSYLKKLLTAEDWVVICGSVPTSLGADTYANILKKLKAVPGVHTVVDASSELLTNALKYKPFLIKPNIFELCEIFKLTTIPDYKTIATLGRKLQEMGARNVIISLGGSGAILVTETKQTIFVKAPSGQAINTVGAGDCMVAGFIHDYMKTNSYFSALNYATASGSACALSETLPTLSQIEYMESLML